MNSTLIVVVVLVLVSVLILVFVPVPTPASPPPANSGSGSTTIIPIIQPTQSSWWPWGGWGGGGSPGTQEQCKVEGTGSTRCLRACSTNCSGSCNYLRRRYPGIQMCSP